MNQISIGNDIVDLEEQGSVLHTRFIERVCTPYEKRQIAENRSSIWLHWAAKEAAYKAVKRLSPEVVFSPISFEYRSQEAVVFFGKISLPCRVVSSVEFTYVICATSREILQEVELATWMGECSMHETSEIGASEAVRVLAVNRIAEFLNIKPQHLEISRSRVRSIPALYVHGQKTNDLLSFSHHGRFVLCSFLANTYPAT